MPQMARTVVCEGAKAPYTIMAKMEAGRLAAGETGQTH